MAFKAGTLMIMMMKIVHRNRNTWIEFDLFVIYHKLEWNNIQHKGFYRWSLDEYTHNIPIYSFDVALYVEWKKSHEKIRKNYIEAPCDYNIIEAIIQNPLKRSEWFRFHTPARLEIPSNWCSIYWKSIFIRFFFSKMWKFILHAIRL